MPLGSIAEFHEWLERETPSAAAWSIARSFIAELGDAPWRAPSVHLPDLSEQPAFEVRAASLTVPEEADVRILYRHTYETSVIDILDVTNH